MHQSRKRRAGKWKTSRTSSSLLKGSFKRRSVTVRNDDAALSAGAHGSGTRLRLANSKIREHSLPVWQIWYDPRPCATWPSCFCVADDRYPASPIPAAPVPLRPDRVVVKHQLLILNRARKRSPNLCTADRVVAGRCAVFMQPGRLIRSAIVFDPSTRLNLHQALIQGKCWQLFSSSRPTKPGLKSPPASRSWTPSSR